MYFDPVAFGKRVRELRTMKGLGREEMAKELGISSEHFRSIESGRRGASIDLIIEMSEILNVSLDYLVRGRIVNFDRAELVQQIADNMIAQLNQMKNIL